MILEPNAHLTAEELVLFAGGESRGRQEARICEHLAACWSCRLRLREFEEALADVARMRRQTVPSLPPIEGPRALLRARLREVAGSSPNAQAEWTGNRYILGSALLSAVVALLLVIWPRAGTNETVAIPRYDLTPGAVRAVATSDVCRDQPAGNAGVMPALARQVFAEYGMPNAERRAYEVDYLITPAMGGSDDIRNLWPQPYAGSLWNAYVKDALEDHLRGMVCNGQLDLATAQHEIAVNWIAAYKKYFHTRRPLPQHLRREEGRE